MNNNKMTIKDIAFAGKKVFCRVDFNVPLNEYSQITENTRIKAALPTIRYLLDGQARLILASHLGRPKGEPKAKYSLKPIAAELSRLLGQPVIMAEDCIGPAVEAQVEALQPGQILLLENVRFHAEEEKNDPAFARQLAGLADIYVNDAFGTAHRAHASTEGITHYLDVAVAGFLLEREIRYFETVLSEPPHPFVVVLGGAKASDKIPVIRSLLPKVDTILIGGGMAYTFIQAQGGYVGNSLVESERIDLARELLTEAADRGVRFLLPTDHILARAFKPDAESMVFKGDHFPDGWMGLDIGPETAAQYAQDLKEAALVVWNGPMGVFEFDRFAQGTFAVAHALADSGAMSIVGGGDSMAAVDKAGLNSRMTHISTGGGASLEYLEGKVLPGVAALDSKVKGA